MITEQLREGWVTNPVVPSKKTKLTAILDQRLPRPA